MSDPVHPTARTFGDVAGAYERARPDYPPEAVEHLVQRLDLRPGRVLADLGAGTGKLTRLLVASGATVHAVEPVDGMRDELARRVPEAVVHGAPAEALPFADGSLDAITAAQAVHWFGPPWVAEAARTLRPGGRIAIVYNVRDWAQPLQRTISEVRERVADGAPSYASGAWRRPLEASPDLVEDGVERVGWSYERTHDEVLDQVRSLAPIGGLAPPAREAVLAEVAEVLAGEPDPVAMRSTTELTFWRRS